MLRVTCDMCGKEVFRHNDRHYIVKIEAYASRDTEELTDEDLDEDHLAAISQEISEIEADPDRCYPFADATRHFRFDLCSDCHAKFVEDPLSRGQLEKLHFSDN